MILTKVNINVVNTDELLNEKIKANQLNKFLLVVPTNRKLRSLKKRIINSAPNKTVTKINIETIGTLTKKLLQVSKQFHELSDEAASIFVEQSIKEVPLIYLSNYNGNIPSGTLSKIKNVISKYKEEGITWELLLKESELLERSEKKKAIDIANIFRVYQQKCNDLNAFEVGDIYNNLLQLSAKSFQSNFSELFEEVDLIVFDGFDAFTSLELSILNKLSFLKEVSLYLNFDYYSYNPIIFSHLEETYQKLQQFGFKKVEDKIEINKDEFIEVVRKKLFLKSNDNIESRLKNRIIEITAPSRDKEVQSIAKEIKSLLLDGKAEPHEISVTFNLINNYSSIVRDAFEAYGIPFNLTDRLKLDNSLSVIAILSFLEILNSDFYYKNIIRAFSNSFVLLDNFSLDSILFSATNLKIVVGLDNWKFSLKRGISFEENLSGLSKSRKRITKYLKASESLDIIEEILVPFTNSLNPTQFYYELNKLTHVLNIPKNILASKSKYKEVEIKALTTFLDSAKEMLNLIEKESSGKVYELSFYLEKLLTLSSSARFNIKERSDYGVLITNINELRGLKFKYSFIGGLIDGDFPTRYRPEIFFSGSFAKKELHHLNEERFHFYQALASWDKGLYLTYPKGDEYTTSTFIKDFEKSFEVSEIIFSNYDNLIYSKEEAERNISLVSNDFPIPEKANSWGEQRKHIEFRATEPHSISNYNGFLFDENETFADNPKYKELPYSISQLETYTQCPFKYFLERILKVEVNEEPDEEVEAVEIGSLLHSIVYDFYTELSNRNIKLSGCSDKIFEYAENLLFKIADQHVQHVFHNSPFAFYEEEKIFGINGNRKHSILFKFLVNERENESGRVPKYFETNFGVVDVEQDKSLSQSEPLLLDDIQLRGKIDRIDVDKTNKLFEVIDYKTGSKKITKGEIEEGLSLQLPIYVWAAKTLLLNNTEEIYDAEAMTIYSLKYKDDIFGKNKVSLSQKKNISQAELIEEYVNIALGYVKNSVENIRKGHFPLTRFLDNNEKVCKFCNYKMICRIDSIKS
ncbi:MAG: PD-(D/E)XK nuclease family protein [Bacteroidetes bacterium]|nr:PD-(D/E)XK nuclease family protein [Bacteroidota bacterium]MBU1116657.1 PD-(D/E)XK nuclease family protein [Bacteroidota bacterium]MBU1797492.1 PD-(D/E)XK nuclease family protein [Bacteroidota bacterium]